MYTDAPERADELRLLTQIAKDNVAAFYGTLASTPRIVLCTSTPCVRKLIRGERTPHGLTYGAALVIIAPKGLNEMILTHEMAHAELHRMARLSDLWDQRIPGWFDEGLASWISGDERLATPTDADRTRILGVKSFSDWGPAIEALGWRRAYGAAMALVDDMVRAQGPEALLDLLARVDAGADFELLRQELLASGAG